MARVVLVLIIVALTIYCAVEVAQAQTYKVRLIPKWLWAAVVIAIPIIGPGCWLFFGRPVSAEASSSKPNLPPDDDPDFFKNM